jgi:hypothetical protein
MSSQLSNVWEGGKGWSPIWANRNSEKKIATRDPNSLLQEQRLNCGPSLGQQESCTGNATKTCIMMQNRYTQVYCKLDMCIMMNTRNIYKNLVGKPLGILKEMEK